jgi:hypothetical protein
VGGGGLPIMTAGPCVCVRKIESIKEAARRPAETAAQHNQADNVDTGLSTTRSHD